MAFVPHIFRSFDSKGGTDLIRLFGRASPISLRLAIKVQSILMGCTIGLTIITIFLGLRGDLPPPVSVLDRHSSIDTEFLNRLVFCVHILAAAVVGIGMLILLSLRGSARRYTIYVNIAISSVCWLLPFLGTG